MAHLPPPLTHVHFVCTAGYDNFSGKMNPAEWVQAVQAKSSPGHQWKVGVWCGPPAAASRPQGHRLRHRLASRAARGRSHATLPRQPPGTCPPLLALCLSAGDLGHGRLCALPPHQPGGGAGRLHLHQLVSTALSTACAAAQSCALLCLHPAQLRTAVLASCAFARCCACILRFCALLCLHPGSACAPASAPAAWARMPLPGCLNGRRACIQPPSIPEANPLHSPVPPSPAPATSCLDTQPAWGRCSSGATWRRACAR